PGAGAVGADGSLPAGVREGHEAASGPSGNAGRPHPRGGSGVRTSPVEDAIARRRPARLPGRQCGGDGPSRLVRGRPARNGPRPGLGPGTRALDRKAAGQVMRGRVLRIALPVLAVAVIGALWLGIPALRGWTGEGNGPLSSTVMWIFGRWISDSGSAG